MHMQKIVSFTMEEVAGEDFRLKLALAFESQNASERQESLLSEQERWSNFRAERRALALQHWFNL
jgi:hypothetical protein